MTSQQKTKEQERSLQKTVEQRRAKAAWEAVEDVVRNHRRYANDYGSTIKRVPMMILTNGLGQALAFLKAKGKGGDNEHEAVFKHISEWVTADMKWENDLLMEIRERSSHDYRRATTEALAYINWLKRFAEAVDLGKEDRSDAPT